MTNPTTEQSSREQEAYEMVDRFLRNNLSDMDYADYSQALDLLSTLSGQTAESGWSAGNTAAPGDFSEEIAALPAQATGEAQIEAAAKKMAECFDYPWEHMPEQGRQSMRHNVRAILAAAAPNSAGLEAVQRDAMRFAWIAKHFTHIGGVYVKDHEVHKFDFRCGDDAPMGDEADADRLRAMVDAAAPQKGDAS